MIPNHFNYIPISKKVLIMIEKKKIPNSKKDNQPFSQNPDLGADIIGWNSRPGLRAAEPPGVRPDRPSAAPGRRQLVHLCGRLHHPTVKHYRLTRPALHIHTIRTRPTLSSSPIPQQFTLLITTVFVHIGRTPPEH